MKIQIDTLTLQRNDSYGLATGALMSCTRSSIQFCLTAIMLTGSIAAGAAQTPDPAKQKGYTSFVATLSALTASASDLIQLERSSGRLEFIRQKLTSKVVSAANGLIEEEVAKKNDPNHKADAIKTTISLSDALNESMLLCDFRADSVKVVENLSPRDKAASITVDHLATVARFNYLNSVATQIQTVSKQTPPTDLISAISSLFASYQIKAAALNPDAIEKVRTQTKQRCQADIKEYAVAYYGQPLTPSFAGAPAAAIPSLSFLGPLGMLIDTVIGIITPVVIDASMVVDEAKREAAIVSFLKNKNNQAALKNAGEALARAVSDFTFAKRLTLAGSFAEQVAVIGDVNVDLAKLDACSDAAQILAISPNGGPSHAFRSCYRAIWAKYQDGVSSALKSASDYDAIADAGDTSTALTNFTKITSNFDDIAQSNLNNPAEFWQYVSQLVNFAGAVSSAASPANRTKIQQEIDAMVKGH